jgi:aryl-alcohol dehydrogenase-like predicted oxidoreductase
MDKITLKQTDLNVSRICFGAMTLGGQTDEASATRMIDVCKEAGINFLDTANVYNKGASEEMLGRVLGNRRRDFILASKVRNKMGDAPDQAGYQGRPSSAPSTTACAVCGQIIWTFTISTCPTTACPSRSR